MWKLFRPWAMKTKQEEPHYFVDSGYIGIGENYEKHCERARILNRKESLLEMQELKHAHTLLLGVVGRMLELNAGKRVPVEEEGVSRRFVLTAAFIQGVSLCEQSILCGLYLQAGSLIRQEYETLTLLAEIKSNRRKDGKVANARQAPWKGSRHYGELSALAHLSDHRILNSLIGYETAWGDFASAVPQYRRENAERLYAFHTAMVLGLVEELKSLYGEMYGYESDERETDVIDVAFSILVEHNVFKAPAS